MTLTRWQRPELSDWSPLAQLSYLRDEMNRVFDSPLTGLSRGQLFGSWAPLIDLYEDKDNLTVKAELPGMKKEEIDVCLQNGALTISGERRREEKHGGAEESRSERFFGRFQRSVMLPVAVAADKIKAGYKDGILTVTLPKAEEAKPKQIEVNVK
jgi:HSP20 family protein